MHQFVHPNNLGGADQCRHRKGRAIFWVHMFNESLIHVGFTSRVAVAHL